MSWVRCFAFPELPFVFVALVPVSRAGARNLRKFRSDRSELEVEAVASTEPSLTSVVSLFTALELACRLSPRVGVDRASLSSAWVGDKPRALGLLECAFDFVSPDAKDWSSA